VSIDNHKVGPTLTQCNRIPANTSGHGFTIISEGMPHWNSIGEEHLNLAPLPLGFSIIIIKIHECPSVSTPRRVSILEQQIRIEYSEFRESTLLKMFGTCIHFTNSLWKLAYKAY